MTLNKMIVHFDIDQHLNKLLSGNKSSFSIKEETLTKIKNKEKIHAISLKSQSKITKKVLAHFPRLKLIVTRTVGLDHLDLKACQEKGIAVYNIPNYDPKSVAEHAVALILSGARNIITSNKEVHQGKFSYKNFLGISLTGKTLGVIGTGRIGLEVIKIAKSLGMKIVAYDIIENQKAAKELAFSYIKLDELLKQSDVITLHIPSTSETKHLLLEEKIKLIKNGAVLVNTARGDLIDTKALVKHLTKFHAVCLDVLENEDKFSKDNPLLKFDNVIITPHIAFYTDESIKIIAKETEENIRRFEKGDKINRVV